MKNLKILLIGLLMLILLGVGYSVNRYDVKDITKTNLVTVDGTKEMSPEAVRADFLYFMSIIKTDYPYLAVNERLNGIKFLENEERYWQSVKQAKTVEAFAEKLSSIIAELNNGHTNLIPLDDQSKMRDMYYKAYGGIVKKGGPMGINYKPWAETLERKESLALYGPLPSLEQSSKDNHQNSEQIIPNNVETQVLESGKIAYMNIKSFNYFNEEADQSVIFDFIQSHLEAEALVIDLRQNGGGSTEYFKHLLIEPLLKKPLTITRYSLMRTGINNRAFIEAIDQANPGMVRPISELNLNQFPKAKPEVFTAFDCFISDTITYSPNKPLGFKGTVYVLVSGQVYSASEAFASFCKDTGFATLIGQRTGGDGYGTDPALFCLPNSGLIGRYPLQYGMMSSGAANDEVKTEPDYVVNSIEVMTDLTQDMCIKKVIELEKL